MAPIESGGKLPSMRSIVLGLDAGATPRKPSALRSLAPRLALASAALCLSALVPLVACRGGTSSAGPSGPGGGGGGGGGATTTGPAKRPPGQVTFASCDPQPCMLHVGRGRYHRCLHAGGGRCFQYGPVCAPADQCMRDPASASYRTCSRVRGGECLEFGASCQPADHCMIDPKDGLHRTCEAASGGACTRFGPPCAPKS